MKTKATLAVCDLDAAVRALDDKENFRAGNQTCLLAQFGMRILKSDCVDSSYDTINDGPQTCFAETEITQPLVLLFDGARKQPSNIALIRRQLPVDLEVEIR